ncbi:hypothetical protein ACSX1A_11630 [Pontibacter sp. MBLB2868]|uniref:hypothetical protein n=1 Tax=Pontibacter sp. MBLB2868 TaxID=3451555 RepID=UPI003F74DC7A
MLSELNQQLADLVAKEKKRAKLRSRLQQVQTDIVAETSKNNELQKSLTKEAADVDKLTGLGLTAVFYTILGSKEEQLNKEKQEYLAAQLKYEESVATLQDLKQEEEHLLQELKSFDGLDKSFKAVLTAKEAALLAENDEQSRQLNHMAEQIISLQSNLKELDEAILAGDNVLTAMNKVVDDLKAAENWGTWDMFGGGMMVTAIKHGKIDDAKAAMHTVQQRLRLFNYELKDVNMNEKLSIHLDSFETFSDYFFDNLIFDWIVQAKIEKSLENAIRLGHKIIEVVKRLQTAQAGVKRQLEEAKLSRGLFIQNAGKE